MIQKMGPRLLERGFSSNIGRHRMASVAAEVYDQWAQVFRAQFVRSLDMWADIIDPTTQIMPASLSGGRRVSEEQCRSTCPPRRDDRTSRCCSHCCCCIAKADLVIQARVGERHVTPIVVENNVRRQHAVELQLSDFTECGDQSVGIVGSVLSPTQIILEPCSEHTANLVIEVTAGKTGLGIADLRESDTLPDVDQCRVFYADLRLKGCDIRAIRIAVAVLPRNCDAYRIDCCSCCC